MDNVESTKNRGGAPKGNQNAAKGAQVTAVIMSELYANDRQKLRDGAKKVADAFAAGEVWAVNLVIDRAEGKPRQAVDLGGQPDNPINVNHGLSETLNSLISDITGRE